DLLAVVGDGREYADDLVRVVRRDGDPVAGDLEDGGVGVDVGAVEVVRLPHRAGEPCPGRFEGGEGPLVEEERVVVNPGAERAAARDRDVYPRGSGRPRPAAGEDAAGAGECGRGQTAQGHVLHPVGVGRPEGEAEDGILDRVAGGVDLDVVQLRRVN